MDTVKTDSVLRKMSGWFGRNQNKDKDKEKTHLNLHVSNMKHRGNVNQQITDANKTLIRNHHIIKLKKKDLK